MFSGSRLADGKTAAFDNDFVDMPGAATKFTIRYDPKSRLYWSLVNHVPQPYPGIKAAATRNTVALISSPDLHQWTINKVLLQHPDPEKHGFQYLDWQFDGNDLIAVARTAWDNAHNYHDANYLTFHRIPNFRSD